MGKEEEFCMMEEEEEGWRMGGAQLSPELMAALEDHFNI